MRTLTDQQVNTIIQAAFDVAQAAPDKSGLHVFAAKVPWSRIHRLREALADVGMYTGSYET